MCVFFNSFFTSHNLFINLNMNFLISYFIYIILSFIIKSIYIALSEFSVYIDFDFKHNVCKYCVHNVINLNNNCKHTVNQHYDYCV